MDKKELQDRFLELSDEAISLFCSGKGESYSNIDLIRFEPGTIDKINKVLARRTEVAGLLDKECQK